MEAKILQKKKSIAPKLRFKGFDGSWESKPLSSLSIKISDGLHSTPSYDEDGEYYFVNGNNLINGQIYFAENTKKVSKDEFLKHKKDLSDRTILISINGTIGSLALYNNEKIILGKSACYINVNNVADKLFIYNSLQTPKIKNFFTSELTGSTIKNLSLTTIKNCEFGIPSLPEQQKIASFLLSVDEKIQQLNRKKELLEQYKKGIMQQLFSGKLRFKDEKGKVFPKWEEKKLGDECEVNPKNSSLPDTFIYIDLESVDSGRLISENRISKNEAPSRAQRKLAKNDILYQTVRPYQMNNLFFNLDGDYIASTGYAQLRTKADSMFLFQLLHSKQFVDDVMERCTGTSFPAINSADLSKIKILLPNIHEQKKIANYLSSLDNKIEIVNNQITQTQTFKKGLLQQMFV